LERIIAAQVELGNEALMQPDPARWREVFFNRMLFEPVIGYLLSRWWIIQSSLLTA